MFSYFEPNFIERFLWKSGFSNFGEIEMTRKKISYLAAILKRYNFLKNFSGIMVFDSAYSIHI